MKPKHLIELGVPAQCVRQAIAGIVSAATDTRKSGRELEQCIRAVVADPASYRDDPHFGPLASAMLEERRVAPATRVPIHYRTWGDEIDEASHAQMRQACELPGAVGAALMPDAHVGYGLPIGGVLAMDNAVVPYAVGVDIACRMKLSVLDLPPESMVDSFERYRHAIEKGSRFGVGAAYEKPQSHPVMDRDWSVTRITRESKDKAWRQLGTSGSGNHFVEFGELTLDHEELALGLPAGRYVALLSHSGSRGTGAAVCSTYSAIARASMPREHERFGRLAWLSLDSQAGQEYWAAMNLMGEYAAANHEVIHRLVSKLLSAQIVAGVENHHNFAWKEVHGGRELVVHRKGATPAGPGVLGVIPGSMATPAFVVRGRGKPESLHSAAHGAGRRMSRTAARSRYRFRAVQKDLEAKGVRVLSAGSDEVPGVYKDIHSVMAQQTDLVDVIARFDPKIVKMCADGSAAED